MIGKLRISQALGSRDIATIRNKQFQDLMRIVLLGVSTGANVERALSLFIKRLEYQINANNRMKAKVGAAQTLTKLGMSLFFPLFSGISAVIISSSLGLFGKSSISTYRSFLIIALAYIPIILYLSSAFSHPERDFAANLHALLPPFLFAICIIVFTQVYLANAL